LDDAVIVAVDLHPERVAEAPVTAKAWSLVAVAPSTAAIPARWLNTPYT
jgi:hypothetical protein